MKVTRRIYSKLFELFFSDFTDFTEQKVYTDFTEQKYTDFTEQKVTSRIY